MSLDPPVIMYIDFGPFRSLLYLSASTLPCLSVSFELIATTFAFRFRSPAHSMPFGSQFSSVPASVARTHAGKKEVEAG